MVFLFLEIAELLCYIRDRTPIKHLINPSYSFKQHLHFRATPFLIYFNLSILAFSFNVIYTFRNVALVDKLSHCEIFLTLLDTTLRITPSPTIQSLEYTIVIFQLTGKTCLDWSKKEKSLN